MTMSTDLAAACEDIDRLLAARRVDEAAQACDRALARFGEAVPLLILAASVVEARQGASTALPFVARAAALAPGDAVTGEAHAAMLERAGELGPSCQIRFSYLAAGTVYPPSLIGLARVLLAGKATLTADRIYGPADFIRIALPFVERPLAAALDLVNALWATEQAPQALAVLRDVLALTPADAEAWMMYAATLSFRNSSAARPAFDRVIALNGDSRSRLVQATLVAPVHHDNAAMLAARETVSRSFDQLLADPGLRVDFSRDISNFPISLFNFAFHGADERPLMEKMAAVFRHADPGLCWTAPHVGALRGKGDLIRIGVVGSFGTLSIYLTTAFLFERFDRTAFSLTFYTTDALGDEMAAHGIAVTRLPPVLAEARRIVAADRNDVLVYNEVFMNHFYYLMAFARLAPVQALRAGHPVTSGLDSIDYFISARTIEREGAQADYTETLLMLREQCTIYPRATPEVAALDFRDFGIPADRHVYLCSQTWYKMHPDFDAVLARILAGDPAGVLVLFENDFPARTAIVEPRLRAALGPDASRLHILPRQPLPRYLALITNAAVMLDSYHFGAGNTCYQAFQLGVPLVTKPTAYMRGRGTYGLYQLMAFEELVAWTDDDYVDLALRVARDADFRARCRAEILQRSGRIFDRFEIASEYEAMFRAMATGASLAAWR